VSLLWSGQRDELAPDFVCPQSRLRLLADFRPASEAAMRWVYIIVIAVFVAIILIFVFQNLGVVTMSFLGFSLRAPLSVIAACMYVLGALTGGSLYALLRKSVRASQRTM
jgi:lipopolysaccharide assembly protein A